MTTEDDFQAALDAAPEDWQTRLVFADWLDERGDPRGPGYRVLGLAQRRPFKDRTSGWTYGDVENDHATGSPNTCFALLDRAWLDLLRAATGSTYARWAARPTRREIEDAAALVFTQLPPERRSELLAGSSDGG